MKGGRSFSGLTDVGKIGFKDEQGGDWTLIRMSFGGFPLLTNQISPLHFSTIEDEKTD
jgi:hypothetical protein